MYVGSVVLKTGEKQGGKGETVYTFLWFERETEKKVAFSLFVVVSKYTREKKIVYCGQ